MRLPYRVVGDYHVDRQEMYAQQCVQSTCTNRPKSFLLDKQAKDRNYLSQVKYCGGYSGEDPPLPIPNREVKLTSADGTAPPGGRVGSCRFSGSPTDVSQPGFLFFVPSAQKKAPVFDRGAYPSNYPVLLMFSLSCPSRSGISVFRNRLIIKHN